jgi:hypothetical protein
MLISVSVAQSDGRSRLVRRAWSFMKRARAICVLSRGGSLTCTANVCTSFVAGTPVRRDTDRQKSGYGPELTPAQGVRQNSGTHSCQTRFNCRFRTFSLMVNGSSMYCENSCGGTGQRTAARTTPNPRSGGSSRRVRGLAG